MRPQRACTRQTQANIAACIAADERLFIDDGDDACLRDNAIATELWTNGFLAVPPHTDVPLPARADLLRRLTALSFRDTYHDGRKNKKIKGDTLPPALWRQLVHPDLHAAVAAYFCGDEVRVRGVESTTAPPRAPPQRLHTDHALGPRSAAVLIVPLTPPAGSRGTVTTRFVRGSHRQQAPEGAAEVVCHEGSGCVLYDPCIVHAGAANPTDSEDGLHGPRAFITFERSSWLKTWNDHYDASGTLKAYGASPRLLQMLQEL